ncbi:alpha-L-rhamnosidase [Kineococcus sp. SYSU DK003]|uniref:alpha-L-rhamnosidase n=1 Tax=Kineococcus sp. SYSU DK003 TaxID=3383124 RepID=UPI003D7D814A
MSAHDVRLRAELRTDTPFVATPRPRLSWTVQTAEENWLQRSVELRSHDELVQLQDGRSVLLDWPFTPLAAGEERTVQVRVTATSGSVTGWSEPLTVRSGFVADGAWTARPIGLSTPDRPAQPVLLRTTFTVDQPVQRATLFWSALGAAELLVNDQPVDEDVLSPGWTTYSERLVHETVDVTALVHPGVNVLAASLAGAWYTEVFGFGETATRTFGEQPRLLAQLHLQFADGTSRVVATDGDWRVSGEGLVVDSGIYAGEHQDARRAVVGWAGTGFDDGDWEPADVLAAEVPVPEARIAPPVRRTDEFPVAQVTPSAGGGHVLDFGQNLVGRLRLRVAGPAGTTIVVRHAEVLQDGELCTYPLRGAAATDTFVLSGQGEEVFEPRFTFHGFRYAEITGWPGEFDPAAVTAVVLGSDNVRTGWFDSSHALLNKLHENVVWGMRGNFLSIPTDCPQRDERLGWTGDIQIFGRTAAFLYDVDGFLTSWLRDVDREQHLTGGYVPMVVPSAQQGLGRSIVAAWGDAATVVPWTLYERFGDLGVLRDQYWSMRTWVETVLAETDGDGLWDDCVQLGDWLDPSAPADKPDRAKVAADVVATAYLAHSLQIVADSAALLGESTDAERYARLAEQSRQAFRDEYVTPNGRITSDAPTAYALALQFDVVTDPATRQRLSDRLAELVRADGYRIGTGFVGTPLVMDGLSAGGNLYAASRLLLQTDCPSWLYAVTMGATTIWERWDSMLPDGSVNTGDMTSFNHYAFGAVADWLHRVVAGLAPAEPGYRRLRIAPTPIPGLDHAAARHLTPYGLASVGWRREGGHVVVQAVVPANTTAVVDLGPGRTAEVGSGAHTWTIAAPAEPSPVAARFDLDTSLSDVIDDPELHRTFVELVRHHDPVRAKKLDDPVWTKGVTVRYFLLFASIALTEAVEQALTEAARRHGAAVETAAAAT